MWRQSVVDWLDILEFQFSFFSLFDYENYCLIINANIYCWKVCQQMLINVLRKYRPRVVFIFIGRIYLKRKFIEHCCPNMVYTNWFQQIWYCLNKANFGCYSMYILSNLTKQKLKLKSFIQVENTG